MLQGGQGNVRSWMDWQRVTTHMQQERFGQASVALLQGSRVRLPPGDDVRLVPDGLACARKKTKQGTTKTKTTKTIVQQTQGK